MSLSGQVALVTGASRGIGQSLLQHLLAAGATVIGTATQPAGVERIQHTIDSAGGQGQGYQLDVCDSEQIKTLFAELSQQWGGASIVINNAAITADNLLLRLKESDWEQVIATNLSAAYHLGKLALKPMLKARYGRIIHISSVVAHTGNIGQSNYAAAKAGLEGFARSQAREVASRNITVNVVAPGMVETDMSAAMGDEQQQGMLASIPMGRAATPAEIASAVLFLASPAASYITGQTLHVNGGMYMG